MTRGWWVAAAALILFLPWQEAGDAPTGLAVVSGLALAALLLTPTVPRPALAGGMGAGWLVGLIAWGALSALRPGYQLAAALVVWSQLVPALWLLALTRAPLAGPSRRGLAALVVLAAILHAAWALAAMATSGGRAHGAFVNPNLLAASLYGALAVALAGLWEGAARRRTLAAAAAVILGATLFATGSRGGLLGALVVLALSLPYRRLARAAASDPRQAAVAVVLLGALAISGGVMWARRRQLDVDPYRFHRLQIWSSAASAARPHPWIGVGVGQLESLAPAHQFPLPDQPFHYSRRWTSAHSAVVQLTVEEGILGLALAGAFLLCLGRALAARARTAQGGLARAALAAVAAAGVHGLFETILESPAVTLSLATLAGLALAPGVAGDGAEDAGRGGRARPWAQRAGAPGLVALAVSLWGAIVAPTLAHRAYLRFAAEDRPLQALEFLQQALRWNAYQPEYALRLGQSLWRSEPQLELRRLALAERWLERASLLNPHDARAETERGHLMMQAAAVGALPPESALRAALRRYERAEQRQPLDPRLKIQAGIAALRLGDLERARAQARAGLDLEPNFLDAWLLAADAEMRAGDREAARRDLYSFQQARRRVQAVAPANEYEKNLVQYNEAVQRDLEEALRR
jgi:O-antigen ligase